MKLQLLIRFALLLAITLVNGFLFAVEVPSETDADPIWAGFREPPATARPYVRWWWNGDKLDHQEILRELDILKAAGIGGVEINSIKFPAKNDPLEIPALDWLSEEWSEMVKTATKGARERGMVADIIVGSGWPFGGRFLPREHQTKILSVGRKRVTGPATITISEQEMFDSVELHLHSKNDQIFQTVQFVRLTPVELDDFEPGVDLTKNFRNGKLTAEIPAGEHIVHYFIVQEGFQAVINGAPGSDGPVLNHFSRESTDYYLNHMSDGMAPTLGKLGEHFRAFFCDSLELEGANWNEDLLLEFERRRGYDLLPWLPYLLAKTGHMGNAVESGDTVKAGPKLEDAVQRVRYDYWITLIELFRERFLEPFTEWCHAQGCQSRVQAYGRSYDPLESSMLVDLPEGETWFRTDIGTKRSDGAFTLNNKFIASGARLAGKRIVSCEEITNTDYVFFAPLEWVKIAGDESNLSGITHSVLHGFNYSPPEAGLPGWVRYGTYFNEHNSWWPYVRRWTDYKARLSWLLQQADPQANIAILHPLADLWKLHGMQRDPFPSKRHPTYAHDLWRALHRNGFNCDYTTENILCRSEMKTGEAIFGPRSYDTIILMEVDTLRADTAASLEKFAASGGKIMIIGRPSSLAPGLKARGEGDQAVSAAMKRIIAQFPKRCRVVSAPTRGVNLTEWFGKASQQCSLVPDVEFEQAHHFLTQTYHKLGDREMFFFVNSSRDQALSVRARFHTGSRTPWVWDLETGSRRVHPWLDTPEELQLELGPAESRVIVFEKAPATKPEPTALPTELGAKQLSGVWQLDLEHVDGSHSSRSLKTLQDLGELDGLSGFAGQANYELEITIPTDAKFRFLDLGKVYEISEVTLDGKSLGVRWYGQHLYTLPTDLSSGKHQLRIAVTTVLGNYCKSLTDNPTAQDWASRHGNRPMGLLGPVRLLNAK